jgi:hypothetical protein
MKEGKLMGNETSGRGTIKFASGLFAALTGKPIQLVSKPVTPIRFTVELTD